MGRASRLHREAVIAGKETPFRQPETVHKMFRCKKCGEHMGEVFVREHIRECWPYPIKDDEPIPTNPIFVPRSKIPGKSIILQVDD